MEITISIPDISSTLQIRGFHVKVVGPGWFYHNHYHPSFELLHCWDGHVTEWLDGQPIPLSAGDWLLIPPGIKHKTLNQADSNFTYLSLLFDIDDPDFRRELKSLANVLVTSGAASETQLPAHLQVLDSIIHSYQLNSLDNGTIHYLSISERLGLQACVLLIVKDIVSILKQNAEHLNGEKTTNTYELALAQRIEQLLMASLCSSDVSVQQIARQMGMSRNQCTRLFSKIFGMSPRQYITSQRLLQAKEKLIQTDQSIESIAYDLGFSSQSHFSRQFKRWTGVSPITYRPKHRIQHKIESSKQEKP